MNSGMFHLAIWLILIVGGSLVVESRTVRLLANSLPTSVNQQQPTAGRHPLTAEIKGHQHNDNKRVSSSPYTHQGAGMDGSKLFDGLTLATYGYMINDIPGFISLISLRVDEGRGNKKVETILSSFYTGPRISFKSLMVIIISPN